MAAGGSSFLNKASDYFLGDGGAGAAGRAAMAQQQEARRAYQETKRITEPLTAEALLRMDKSIAQQDKNLARQEQMIAQIDPTIIEASQQALRLMKGEDAQSLSPLKNQRALQRQKLLDSLRQQLGPGAETSTAGMQAITRFDQETGNLMSGAQQSYLNQMGSIAGQFNTVRPDMFREIMGGAQLAQNKAGLGYQQASLLSNARQGLMSTAGAQYTTDMLRGQQDRALGMKLAEGGIAYATGGASVAAGKQ